ncbi:hypothetical protein, partial [uncultured Thiodictyon sp.]|uniref:hypothetical protein n=1 Tax=uncultured Thiodictyon sp. TaxID=1846217 RepID=UPI0025FDB48B
LWIAQTDELCEQAVQSFRQVWLNRGAQATDLRVVRFWGGAGNPSAPAAGEPTVRAGVRSRACWGQVLPFALLHASNDGAGKSENLTHSRLV